MSSVLNIYWIVLSILNFIPYYLVFREIIATVYLRKSISIGCKFGCLLNWVSSTGNDYVMCCAILHCVEIHPPHTFNEIHPKTHHPPPKPTPLIATETPI